MIYLFPESFARPGRVDSEYLDQFTELQNRSLAVALVDERGRIKGDAKQASIGLYRGWMMSPNEYGKFYNDILGQGIRLINDVDQYIECHYISGWYDCIKALTIPSVLFASVNEISNESLPKWDKYFVKDFVKSLSTNRGSIALNISEIMDVVSQIKEYRGKIDGGVCVRQYIDIDVHSEERHFVYMGKAYSRDGSKSLLVEQVLPLFKSNYYCIDVCRDKFGNEIIIEIGDGQVSDIKKWDVKAFINIIAAQQVDSAEASTIAVPPSDPSGSPR